MRIKRDGPLYAALSSLQKGQDSKMICVCVSRDMNEKASNKQYILTQFTIKHHHLLKGSDLEMLTGRDLYAPWNSLLTCRFSPPCYIVKESFTLTQTHDTP